MFSCIPLRTQAFTNCVLVYDRVRSVHANGITRTQKFMHVIDFSVKK